MPSPIKTIRSNIISIQLSGEVAPIFKKLDHKTDEAFAIMTMGYQIGRQLVIAAARRRRRWHYRFSSWLQKSDYVLFRIDSCEKFTPGKKEEILMVHVELFLSIRSGRIIDMSPQVRKERSWYQEIEVVLFSQGPVVSRQHQDAKMIEWYVHQTSTQS